MLLPQINAGAQSRLPACPKDQKLRHHNCFGTQKFPDGGRYVGEFQNNKFNGQGTATHGVNGTKYVGEFKDGTLHGQGTLTFPNGAKYVGEFKNGQANGQGTHTFANGDIYVGAFKDSAFNGHGTLTFLDGSKIVGEFKNGQANGQGTHTFANGETYVGAFKDSAFNGTGTLTFLDDSKFVGEFKGGERWQGTQTFADGRTYVGQYNNGKRNGQGTLTFADGRKYVGVFKDGIYHGRGTLYAADGSVAQAGLWENDKFVRAMAVANSPSGATPQAAVQPPAQPPSITAAPTGKRVALIIGNAEYKHSPLLINPARDATLLASTLRNAGFQSVVVMNDLTREGIIRALRDFAVTADTADWAVVYYSGHGIEFGGANYIIPVDAALKADRDIDLEAVNVGQVLNAIEGARRLRVVILDACRDNPFANQMRRTMASRSLGRGLARVEPEAGTLVVYAAKHGEVALDGAGQNSPFAEALVKRINQRPGLEIRRLFDFVRDDVLGSTGRRQQPFSYGSLSASEDFFFVR